MNLKKTFTPVVKLVTSAVLGCAAAFALLAATPTYTTLSNNGNASAGAAVIFPAISGLQIRIVSANWNSDSNTATLSWTYGTTAAYITSSNATSDTNLVLNATNGFSSSCTVVVQTPAGLVTNATVNSISSNSVGLSAAIGLALPANTEVFLMSSATTIPIGATTNAANGEAIYVSGLPGRPVRAVLSPALVTNKLNAVVARYE